MPNAPLYSAEDDEDLMYVLSRQPLFVGQNARAKGELVGMEDVFGTISADGADVLASGTAEALAANQLAKVSQVYCLGSRLLLSAVVRAAPRPEGILAAVTTEEEGLAKVVRHQPDLLVVSEGLERGCGVELTLRVKRDHPRTRVLLLVSRNASRSRAREAIAAGCDGVLRDAGLGAGGDLAAIRTICHGGQVIDRSLEDLWRQPVETVPRLSQREKQVMAAVARGYNNQEIARHLILSADTVKTHVSRVLVKLSARDRTHATVRALELGLLEWPANGNER
jgi:DNA-binding NarL/FixJ family response regulator